MAARKGKPARQDKPIYVHADVFKTLREAKIQFEGMTGCHMTWSAFLYALGAGALAISALAGMKIHCPTCGDSGMELYFKSFEVPEENQKGSGTHPS